MGQAKDKMIRDNDNYQQALKILTETETLLECPGHGTYFNGTGDVTAAYKLANYKLSQIEADADDRRALTDAIKQAYAENSHSDKCERCAADNS